MSWSFYMSGSAKAVRETASKQLAVCAENCKAIPAEAKSIEGLAAAIDQVCANAEGQGIKIDACGSAWSENGKLRGFQFHAEVELIDMADPK